MGSGSGAEGSQEKRRSRKGESRGQKPIHTPGAVHAPQSKVGGEVRKGRPRGWCLGQVGARTEGHLSQEPPRGQFTDETCRPAEFLGLSSMQVPPSPQGRPPEGAPAL